MEAFTEDTAVFDSYITVPQRMTLYLFRQSDYNTAEKEPSVKKHADMKSDAAALKSGYRRNGLKKSRSNIRVPLTLNDPPRRGNLLPPQLRRPIYPEEASMQPRLGGHRRLPYTDGRTTFTINNNILILICAIYMIRFNADKNTNSFLDKSTGLHVYRTIGLTFFGSLVRLVTGCFQVLL